MLLLIQLHQCKMTEYKDEVVTAEVKASGNNFLFFGDTYMTGNIDYKLFKLQTGWKAYIDNHQTVIYKTNHGFMGIVIPAGKHDVIFKFAPESFYITKYIDLILSGLVVFGFIFT